MSLFFFPNRGRSILCSPPCSRQQRVPPRRETELGKGGEAPASEVYTFPSIPKCFFFLLSLSSPSSLPGWWGQAEAGGGDLRQSILVRSPPDPRRPRGAGTQQPQRCWQPGRVSKETSETNKRGDVGGREEIKAGSSKPFLVSKLGTWTRGGERMSRHGSAPFITGEALRFLIPAAIYY